MKREKHIKRIDSFILHSIYGNFKIIGYEISNDTKEEFALAIIKGRVKDKDNVLVRIHSQCIFSEVLGAQNCDCREQLIQSLKMINKNGGVLIYLDQEGRGHGLLTKIKELSFIEKGFDTYEASIKVGERPDNRNYKYAVEILKDLKIHGLKLITNNPEKIQALKLSSIKYKKRIPIEIKPNKYNEKYLRSKKKKFGHLLKII